ncbi:MAG: hypothetical protein J6A67_01270 [Clostridia bacterium]|nr:hypothetical protein [Clostridia bacterium]
MKRCLSIILALCIMLSVMPITLVSVAAEDYDETLQPGSMGYTKQMVYDENGNVVETGGRLKPDTNFGTMSESTIPSSYDARSKSLVTSVKNQGASSNCWVFAATSVLETNSIVNGYTKLSATDFSEPHLAWFSINTATNNKTDPNYGDGNGIGAQVYQFGGDCGFVTRALARWAGIADGSKVTSNYPTTTSQLSKLPTYTDADRFNTSSGVIIRSMEQCTTADEVKQWIIDNGSITASYNHADSNSYIKNGSNYVAYYYPIQTATNHVISVIGWDDNFAASKFNSSNRPEGNGAWLCKNSWGSGWGNGGGYFWISYYDKSISDFCGFTTQPAEKFDNNYTHNGSDADHLINSASSEKIANVFTAKYREELTAVSTYTENEDVTVNVSIYVNLSPGETNDPTSGELAQSFTVEIPRIGYHTIDLPEAVPLEHGCVFSVVLEMSVSSGNVRVPIEGGDYSASTPGESLIYRNGTWRQTESVFSSIDGKNFCIQAFSVTTCDHLNQETVTKTYDDCSGQGYERIVCLDCNGILEETLYPRIAHTTGAWITEKEASCTETGLSVKICTVCNQTAETQEIPMLEHTGEWKVGREATCTKEGSESKVCTMCGKWLDSREIPMIDHNPGDWMVERVTTCTVAGILAKKCTECSTILETQDIPATGHSPGDWEVKIATNCWREGTLARLCQTCGLTLESQKIPKVDHDYIYSVVTSPTCENSGVGKYTCSMCRGSYRVNIEPTGEHIYSEWVFVKEPTSTQDGEKTHTCTGCSKTENEVIKATGFETKSDVSVDYLTGVISGIRAGDVSLDEYVELADEGYSWSYENSGRLGSGTKALLMNGEEVVGEYTILLYGDINGDGWYDGEDAVLANCLVNNMLSIDSLGDVCYAAADCNHDGVTDVSDIRLLREAGTLLASVDQTKTAEVLFESSSAYTEYLDVIDQSPEQVDEPLEDDNVENIETGSESTESSFSIIDLIVRFIKEIFNVFSKIW